jgi:hypothetical protein
VIVPPWSAGVVNATVAVELPAVAVPMPGASGRAAGTTGDVAVEARLVPAQFVAVTVNV